MFGIALRCGRGAGGGCRTGGAVTPARGPASRSSSSTAPRAGAGAATPPPQINLRNLRKSSCVDKLFFLPAL